MQETIQDLFLHIACGIIIKDSVNLTYSGQTSSGQFEGQVTHVTMFWFRFGCSSPGPPAVVEQHMDWLTDTYGSLLPHLGDPQTYHM